MSWVRHKSVSLFAFTGTSTILRSLVDPSWKEQDLGNEPEPFTELSEDAAQVLMDDLWRGGIRPTEGEGSAGAMTAVQEHLKDLRAIVFRDYTDGR